MKNQSLGSLMFWQVDPWVSKSNFALLMVIIFKWKIFPYTEIPLEIELETINVLHHHHLWFGQLL
jgi:hypothetical protein